MLGPLSIGPVDRLWIFLMQCGGKRVIQVLSDHSYSFCQPFLRNRSNSTAQYLQKYVNIMIQFR